MSKRKSDAVDGSSGPAKVKKIATSAGNHWSDGLKRAMQDPSLVLKSDEFTVTIRDKFPKARYHFLIIPKHDVVDIQCLNRTHIELLERMEREAFLTIDSHSNGISSDHFNIGYHAVPSMRPFHLHVISKDFDSGCLKTKKHWNSFTTEFFRKSSDVLDELKEHGKVKIEKERFETLLKSPLRCHWCKEIQRNIPILKLHIKCCSRNN